jgi:hypothetical protein
MKRKLYLKQDEQIGIIQQLGLKCSFEIGLKTSFIMVGDCDTDYDVFIVVLLLRDSGTILQKWHCSKNDDGSHDSKIIYENTNSVITEVICDVEKCDDISNNNNIKCYVCDKPCKK